MRKTLFFAFALLFPVLTVHAQGSWVAPLHYVDGVFKDGATTYDKVNKFGRNPDIDTATDPEDMIDWGGLYGGFAIATSDTVVVVSDASADSIGGTGGLIYTIQGLDVNKRKVTITDTLRGTLPDTASFSMYRVYRAWIASAGSGGTNAGNITIRTPKDSVLAYIAADFGQTEQAVYTCGTEYQSCFLTGYYVDAETPTGAAGNVKLYILMRPLNGAWRIIETFGFNSGVQNKYEHVYPVPFSIPAGADVVLRVQTVAQNNTSLSGGFSMWEIK